MLSVLLHQCRGECGIFGAPVKFVVKIEEPEETGSSTNLRELQNAFSILLQAQRDLHLGNNGLPNKMEECTKKDKLYNYLIIAYVVTNPKLLSDLQRSKH